jgi:hypothetical protein
VLKQTGSVATYIAKFDQLTSLVRFNNDALKAQFYFGLNRTLKDKVARVGMPDTLVELQDFTAHFDQHSYERLLEKRAEQ